MKRLLPVLTSFAILAGVSFPASATAFVTTNLVTDDQGANPAQITDANLVNAWGMSASPTGPVWISDNGTGVSTLYNVSTADVVSKAALTVTLPGTGVTGQVFNADAAAFNGDRFLFVSESGTVSGWRPALGTTAETLAVASADNVYKGAAIATVAGSSYLYAANFKSGAIDVFKGAAGAPSLAGAFVDPTLPAGYAPFNIQRLGGALYVAYAKVDSASTDEVAGAGFGFVSRFDLQGNLVDRIATGGALNAPWGLAIAPGSFGEFAGALLVGNFGDGTINAFDLLSPTHTFLGALTGADGNPLSIEGLWALGTGNGGSGGSLDRLYFTAGPNDEAHGLLGSLSVIPEPASLTLVMVGLVGCAASGRRRSSSARLQGSNR